MKKKLIIVILCLIILYTGGCSMMNKKQDVTEKPTREEVKQEMLDYLKEKYGVTFECQSIEYISWSQTGHESMFAYPEGTNPNYNFPVYRYHKKDGSFEYKDGYVGYLMRPLYFEKFENIVTSYFPESTLRVGFRYTYPESFNQSTTFEEFNEYASKKNNIGFSIYIPVSSESEEADVKNKVELIKQELQSEIKIATMYLAAYLEEDYQKYVVEDTDSREANESYGTRYAVFITHTSWGQTDFDYEYEEDTK